MDIEVNTLAQIKAETGRDLDNQIDENTLVSGEKSNGTFGVFKLFAAIKNCIDNWITTIAGNKNFTGAVTINSKAVATTEAVNNALANYTKVIYLTGNYDALEDAIKAVSSQALANTLYLIRFEQNGVHIGQFYSYSDKAEVPEFGMGTVIKFNGNAFKFYVDWNTHQWVINNA